MTETEQNFTFLSSVNLQLRVTALTETPLIPRRLMERYLFFLFVALAAIAAAHFLLSRTRRPAESAQDKIKTDNDLPLAAHRFGIRRKGSLHPADLIDDPNVAAGAIGAAFLEMTGHPEPGQRDALVRALHKGLNISHWDAVEMTNLGHWFVWECGGPAAAVPVLAQRLHTLSGAAKIPALITAVQDITYFSGRPLSDEQKTALEDIQRGLKIG